MRHQALVFGLCWAVNVSLNEQLRTIGRRYRPVTVGPLHVVLDVTDQSGFPAYFYGDPYEPLLTAELFAHLHEGDVFVDIGANAGLFTMLAAKIVGATGRVVAFEPHPIARAELVELLHVNGVRERVDVVAAALSDAPAAAMPLHLADQTGLSTLDPTVAPGRHHFTYTNSVLVEVTTLDAWMAAHSDLRTRLTMMKIDVEGLEDRVVAGMQETVRSAPRLRIVCETPAGSLADAQLIAAGFAAATLEAPEGSYVGNRVYCRRTN
ncbi:MAG TPA: FkbM family methyltransferase [Vicinamibacterales bacterium]|nr:FkbM family methyltransferase [Vicinamibacterales bacterium]